MLLNDRTHTQVMIHQRILRNCEGMGHRDFIQTGLGALGGLGLADAGHAGRGREPV